jgi:integrase
MRVAFYTGVRLSENLNLTFDQLLWPNQFQIKQKGWRMRTVYILEESWIKELALELQKLYANYPEELKKHKAEKNYVYLKLWSSNWWKQYGICW